MMLSVRGGPKRTMGSTLVSWGLSYMHCETSACMGGEVANILIVEGRQW